MKDRWLDMKADAETRVKAFFGELKTEPRLILCSHQDCERIFGFTTLGVQTIEEIKHPGLSNNQGGVF